MYGMLALTALERTFQHDYIHMKAVESLTAKQLMKNYAVPVHVLFALAIPGPPAFYTEFNPMQLNGVNR